MTSINRRHMLAMASGSVLLGMAGKTFAAGMGLPTGKPILHVGGKISKPNIADEAVFDIPMLEALGTRTFRTATPWTDGVPTWEGVPLSVLMDAVGATGTTIRATALNDYVADMPMAGLAEEGSILAMRRDGELMPVNNKGPLFILYPFDDHEKLRQQSVYMRCAWQIARLDVL